MRTKLVSVVVLVLIALPLSGCPGAPAVSYGFWLFTVATTGNPNPTTNGLVLLQHGFTSQAPSGYPGSFTIFGGPVTWEQLGSAVSMRLDLNPTDFVFEGTVQSSTSMSGTWMKEGDPSTSGTWSAEWDPET